MSPLHRRLACLALMVAIGGCGQPISTGQPGTSGASSATAGSTTKEPSVSPSPIVRPLRDTGGTAILDPGTYVLDYFPVDLAFDIPDGDPPGWHVGMSTPDAAVVLWYTAPDFTYLYAFWNVDNVFVDPCDAPAGELEPAIGPSVDDLVGALTNLPEFQVTVPVDVTVGDFQGKEIELTALDPGHCPDVIAFSWGDGFTDVPVGATLRLQILDVDGVRIVMTDGPWINEPVKRDAAAEAELQQILDSIRIEPAT
jgi:hypothetical protein